MYMVAAFQKSKKGSNQNSYWNGITSATFYWPKQPTSSVQNEEQEKQNPLPDSVEH